MEKAVTPQLPPAPMRKLFQQTMKDTGTLHSNWDSNEDRELPQPSVEFLKHAEAAMRLLKLQYPKEEDKEVENIYKN